MLRQIRFGPLNMFMLLIVLETSEQFAREDLSALLPTWRRSVAAIVNFSLFY
jgi:hypothetical protein